MKKFLIPFVLCLMQTACSHSSHDPSFTDPTLFTKETLFKMDLQAYQTDKKTNQTIPSSKRDITVVYQFEHLNWRRSLRIVSQNRIQSMFQEGIISDIDHEKMNLVVNNSSCDDAEGIRISPSTDLVYYQASPTSLNLNTSPFPPPAKGLTDVVGQIFGNLIVDSMRTILEQTFTFGSARTFLTSGHGSFKTDKTSEIDLGEIGCFGVFGQDFAPSKIRPKW